MHFVIRTNTIVLYFNLLSEASALFWKKYYFRFVALNKTFGFKVYRIPDPGFDPGVRFPFFLIETPSITGQKLYIDVMAATVYERENYSGEIYLVLPTSFIRPCGL